MGFRVKRVLLMCHLSNERAEIKAKNKLEEMLYKVKDRIRENLWNPSVLGSNPSSTLC